MMSRNDPWSNPGVELESELVLRHPFESSRSGDALLWPKGSAESTGVGVPSYAGTGGRFDVDGDMTVSRIEHTRVKCYSRLGTQMDISHPMKSVIPSAQGEVLAVLARTTSSLTGRQIAGLTEGRVSQKRVSDILNTLTGAGIVLRQVAGSSHLHTLNREHLAADAIVQLASVRDRLIGRIIDDVQAWRSSAEGVWLFGSVARGDGGPDSDVDILVVRNDDVEAADALWLNQLDALAQAVAGWTGNDCRIVEYSAGEIARLIGDEDPLVRSIGTEGIRIAGRRSLLAGPRPDGSRT